MQPVDIGFVFKLAFRKGEIKGDPHEKISSAAESCFPFLIVFNR
jgi:hypothetical protein